MKTLLKSALALAFSLSLVTQLSAQHVPCGWGDDGFQRVDCCESIDPFLPEFPEVSSRAAHGFFVDCNVRCQNVVSVTYGKPERIACDQAVQKLEIRDPNGVVLSSGVLTMKYSRTWERPQVRGQVWRWLINGYFVFEAPALTNCPYPRGRVFLTGFIDYATNCSGFFPFWEWAASVHTTPACLPFAPPTPVALSMQTHHFVAPSTFVFSNGVPPSGSFRNEALRSSFIGVWPFDVKCVGESPVLEGALVDRSVGCLCAPVHGNQWVNQHLFGDVYCRGIVTSFKTADGQHPQIPTGMVSRYIGRWTAGIHDDLTIHYGYIDYTSPCATVEVRPRYFHGVTTTGAGRLFPPPLLPVIGDDERRFLDLATLLNIPSPSTDVGIPSDLVLNLNPQ